jgi:hypothetical protein
LDNHANQLNPKVLAGHRTDGLKGTEAANQLRARQLNSNNALYRAPKK